MKKLTYFIIGSFLILPLTVANTFGLTLQDFRQEVYRPTNLPAGELGDVAAETKATYILNSFIDLILYASGSVAVLMLVYAGIRLITSAGNEEEKTKWIKVIRWSIYGLLLVILAFALVTNIIDLIYRATT